MIYTCHRRDHGECCLDIKHYWREPWDEDDVDSLAEVMGEALADEGERQRRGANALSLIRKQYDWREIAQRYVEVYESISRSG